MSTGDLLVVLRAERDCLRREVDNLRIERDRITGERDDLRREVEDLRAFEREYRSRLIAYFEQQMRALKGGAP